MDHKTTELYRDDDCVVFFRPGNADFVLITFSDLVFKHDGHNFYAGSVASKLDIPCIGFVALRPNWYTGANLASAVGHAERAARQYAARIVYGGSMGGYGALKFSRDLNATAVLALCPQWSLDPAECVGFDPGWNRFFTPSMKRMGIKSADISGNVFILYDKYDHVDRQHALSVRSAYPDARLVSVPWVGHNVTSVMAGTDTLHQLMIAARSNDIDRVVNSVARKRRSATRRFGYISRRAALAHPALVFDRVELIERWGARDPRPWTEIMSQALMHYARRSDHERAASYISKFYNGITKLDRKLSIGAPAKNDPEGLSGIKTTWQTYLLFDVNRERVVHTRPDGAHSDMLTPVGFEWRGGTLNMFINNGHNKIYLSRRKDGSIGVSTPRENVIDFDVAITLNNGRELFSIREGDDVLSARKAGAVHFGRYDLKLWELFDFGIGAIAS